MFGFNRVYYHDNFGHPIKDEKDILVTSLSLLENASGDDRYKSVQKDKLEGVGEKCGNLYSAYRNPLDGEMYDVLCSAYTKEVVPFQCLNKPTYTILLCGIRDVGKTTSAIQYCEDCPDLISGGNSISVHKILETELLPENFRRNVERYSKGNVPMPNPKTVRCESIPLYVKSYEQEAVLKLLDVPGEVALTGADQSFDHSTAVFLFLDMFRPLDKDAKKRLHDQRDRIVQLLNNTHGIPVYVILTKADKYSYSFQGENCNLSKLIPESTEKNDFGMKQLKACYRMDEGGYDFEVYRKHEKLICSYLDGMHAGIYQDLVQSFGKNLRFFLTGNYMRDVSGEDIPNNVRMYRVEQPLLHFLAENYLYPSRNQYENSQYKSVADPDIEHPESENKPLKHIFKMLMEQV